MRLPNNASFIFDGTDGESIVQSLDLQGIAVSTGSACTSASNEASHVLIAMGLEPQRARGALRLTLGSENTMEDIERPLSSCAQYNILPIYSLLLV
jgi:cysteine desulfurase